MRTSIVLVTGLMLIAAILAVTLARSPPILAGTNRVPAERPVGIAEEAIGACQASETLPAGTSAIRLSLIAIVGARVSVKVLSGPKLLTQGATAAGWTGSEVAVAVTPLVRSVSPVTVCFNLAGVNGEEQVRGRDTPAAVAAVSRRGQRLNGRFRVEYVRAGHTSWLSLLASIARHMSWGRGWSGIWIVFFILALALAVVTLTSWAIVRELG